MENEYRYAQTAQELEMLRRFCSMQDTARILAETWPEGSAAYLVSIRANLSWVGDFLRARPETQGSYAVDQLENIEFTLDIAAASQDAHAPDILITQLPCFLLELREEIYFWACVHPFKERMAGYYQHEFAPHHKNTFIEREGPQCDVSIFIPAKDQLSYTRQCVESILRETDASTVSYELILINHGSTDDTQRYFQSIPGARILHFKHNVRMMMFSSAMRVCRGRYMAFVSNDTIVTPRWLTLLMRCIRSDPSVISATPTTPHIANFQSVVAPYSGKDEFLRFAENFNKHDPSKWERRVRILPVIALYDIEKVNGIGFADRYFSTMEFWDDDFSLRARRAGFRQLLCRDVFCHHYGSITGGEAQRKENTLQKGRALFIEKHGVDPWENGAYYDYAVLTRLAKMDMPRETQENIFGLDCGFGDTLLQIGNMLQSVGTSVQIDSATLQSEYALDLRSISRSFYNADSEEALIAHLRSALSGKLYRYIYVGRPLETYGNWRAVLNLLLNALCPGGYLLFSLTNALNYTNFQWFSALAFPPEKEKINYLNPEKVLSLLREYTVDITVVGRKIGAAAELLAQLTSQVRFSRLPAPALSELLDTAVFQYYVHKKQPLEADGENDNTH